MTKQSGIDLMKYVRPLLQFVPDVQKTNKMIPLKDKLIWTLLTLVIFLVCSQIPLYGIQLLTGDDPMYWTRVIMASNRGTLMELGTGPIVTAGMVLQFLTSSGIVSFNMSKKEDKEEQNQLQKLIAIFIALFQSVSYVLMGNYGDLEELGAFRGLMIVIQLVLASVLVIYLDELLSKGGYGLVSAISLFIATNFCEDFLWKSFSFVKNRDEYIGAFVAFFSYLKNQPNKLNAIRQGFLREGLTNLNNVLITVMIFMIVNFFQGFQVNVSIHDKRIQGHVDSYGIKLFYTSNTPIIIQSTFVSNLLFISRVIYNNFKQFRVIRWLGVWKSSTIGGQSFPVSGLVYYLTPPMSVKSMFQNPFHTIIYISFILISCSLISRFWISIGGNSAKDVAQGLKNQNITAYGGTEKLLEKKLERNINIAAYFGGFCIGALTLIADFLGTIGTGTGILLTSGIIYEIFEEVKRAQKQGHTLW